MIRTYQNKDQEEVMKIWLQGNLQAHEFIAKEFWLEHFEEVSQLLAKAEVYVYEKEKKIQGFIGCNQGYIAGIFILEGQQSKGIRKQLLNTIKKVYPKVRLKVYSLNQKAVSFYLREGFEIIKQETDKSTNQKEYIMEWSLS